VLPAVSVTSGRLKRADAGLVTRDQRGKWAYYCIAPETAAPLSDMLRLLVQDDVGALPAGQAADLGDGVGRAVVDAVV
jgi:hypothetical protein